MAQSPFAVAKLPGLLGRISEFNEKARAASICEKCSLPKQGFQRAMGRRGESMESRKAAGLCTCDE
jgi:hypothetical protein